jgi:hypothetical protein
LQLLVCQPQISRGKMAVQLACAHEEMSIKVSRVNCPESRLWEFQ